MSTLHAFKPAASDSEAARPDALAKYRLAPGAIATTQSPAVGPVAIFWRGLISVVETLYVWRERARSRRSLSDLDARMLRDIGISPSQFAHEAGKPFWRD